MAKEPLKVLTESMFYVLLSLLRQERCGTEIVRFVDDTTAGRVPLGPGTLYTILAKFQEEGLIRETAVEGRKRTYAITDRGRALYRQELSRLKLCVADGDREGEGRGGQQAAQNLSLHCVFSFLWFFPQSMVQESPCWKQPSKPGIHPRILQCC